MLIQFSSTFQHEHAILNIEPWQRRFLLDIVFVRKYIQSSVCHSVVLICKYIYICILYIIYICIIIYLYLYNYIYTSFYNKIFPCCKWLAAKILWIQRASGHGSFWKKWRRPSGEMSASKTLSSWWLNHPFEMDHIFNPFDYLVGVYLVGGGKSNWIMKPQGSGWT